MVESVPACRMIAFHPAGWRWMNVVTSYTRPCAMSQQSSMLLCRATSSRVKYCLPWRVLPSDSPADVSATRPGLGPVTAASASRPRLEGAREPTSDTTTSAAAEAAAAASPAEAPKAAAAAASAAAPTASTTPSEPSVGPGALGAAVAAAACFALVAVVGAALLQQRLPRSLNALWRSPAAFSGLPSGAADLAGDYQLAQ
mmetsp:Transcript_42473/g.99477  ORF Transcript_42473/g.99477 Transcript_42473/m.99477 type:complete len:200 (-) Transcript_42473:128-727(-)